MRPPIPPFDAATAAAKVRAAEDACNSRDPDLVVRAYARPPAYPVVPGEALICSATPAAGADRLELDL
jgi:hypothetical protein